jgi:hypothetical protein
MQKCFADKINTPWQPDQLGPPKPMIAVYVNDIVVKAPRTGDLITTLDAMFANLRSFSIKLNPEKCSFGVPKGKLLGYIVSERGIEANPKKNHGHLQDGCHMQCERRATAHRLSSHPQLVHLPTG